MITQKMHPFWQWWALILQVSFVRRCVRQGSIPVEAAAGMSWFSKFPSHDWRDLRSVYNRLCDLLSLTCVCCGFCLRLPLKLCMQFCSPVLTRLMNLFTSFCICNSKTCFLQVETFFAQLIQRVSPKSFAQATAEVTVTQKFLENFSGDQVC